ncbi:MAG TPA: cupin domain-containing protein [Candidatus Sulfotelmatobacter sp.]|nr:cupin domain-containing protein [Candidatus Sulfotelmatobacter sp.]
MRQTDETLATLIAPVDESTFLERYFEREPLHVERNAPGHWRALYAIGDVEDAIAVGARDVDRFALVRTGGPPLPAEQYTIERPAPRARATGRVPQLYLDPRAIATAFASGYSMLIKDASFFSARLQRLCTALQRRLAAFVQSNVYLTPPNAQGFGLHHDTHDTLILQLEGTKIWRIYKPLVELPIESQPFRTENGDPRAVLLREVTLREGDTLYIPRGYPHAAATSEVRSLHLTLALLPVRVVDLLDALVRLAPLQALDLRRSLGPDWLDAPDFVARFRALAVDRFAAACTPAIIGAARDLLANELFGLTRTDAGGIFDQVGALTELDANPTVRLRADVPYHARVEANAFELVLAGKSIGYPLACVAALRRLEAGPASVAELDAAAPGTGRAFARALVLEGLATISP